MDLSKTAGIAVGLAVVMAVIAAFFLFMKPGLGGVIELNYSEVFLDPKSQGFTFAKPGMEQYLKTRAGAGGNLFVETHDRSCSIPFNESLIQVVRITKFAKGIYNIACMFGPVHSKSDLKVKNPDTGNYYAEFDGWFRECTPEAADLFEQGAKSPNEVINACTGVKSAMAAYGLKKPDEINDYYYVMFACNELKPPIKSNPPGLPPWAYCPDELESLGNNSTFSGVVMLVDAQRKEVYVPFAVTSARSDTSK